jgi:hypothetical protein
VEAKRFSKQIRKSVIGTNLHARGTGPKGVMHTKKVKSSVRLNAYEDDSWRLDYDLKEVPEPVHNSPTRTQSTGPTHRAQEDAAHTRRGLDATIVINLSDGEEFHLKSPDCTHESSPEGPASHANLPAPSVRRNPDVPVRPSTRPTYMAMRSSVVVQEGVPIRESDVSKAAFKIACLGATLNPLCIAQHMGTNLKYKAPIGGGKIGACFKGEHEIPNVARPKPHV